MSEAKTVMQMIRAYIIGAIIVIIWSVVFSYILAGNRGVPWPYGEEYYFHRKEETLYMWLVLPLFVSMLIAAVSKAFKFTRHEAVIVQSMSWSTWIIPSYFGAAGTMLIGGAAMWALGDPWLTYFKTPGAFNVGVTMPDPTNEAIWNAFLHGGAINWSVWAGPFIYWLVYVILMYYVITLATTLFFRKQWIDVEALPYPAASAALKLVDWSIPDEKGKVSLWRNKWLALGMVIGAVTTLQYWLHWIIPAVPVLGAALWKATDFIPAGFIPWVPLAFWFESWVIGGFYILPLGILLSYIMFFIAMYWVIPLVLYGAGVMGPMPQGTDAWSIHGYFYAYHMTPVTQTTIMPYVYTGALGMPSMGIAIACIMYPLLTVGRRYFKEVVRGIIKHDREAEKAEPLPYRAQWILLLVLIIIWTSMIYVGSKSLVPVWYGLFFIFFVTFLTGFVPARLYGDMGGVFMQYQWPPTHPFMNMLDWAFLTGPLKQGEFGQPEFLAPSTLQMTVAGIGAFSYMQQIPGIPAPRVMESYKMASVTGLHSKHIFIATTIAIVLAMVTTHLTWFTGYHTYGMVEKWVNSGGTAWNGGWVMLLVFIENATNPYMWWPNSYPPQASMWAFMILGIIVGVLLFEIRARVPRLSFLHPISAIFVWWFDYPGFFWSILIAYIAKWITIRIGGTKLYEEKGMPVAMGMCVIFGIISLLCSAAEAYKIMAK